MTALLDSFAAFVHFPPSTPRSKHMQILTIWCCDAVMQGELGMTRSGFADLNVYAPRPPPPMSSRSPVTNSLAASIQTFSRSGRVVRSTVMSHEMPLPFHDQYAQPPLLKYRPTGTARDTWVYDLKPLTEANHTKTLEDLYWEQRMGQPEFRGKAKGAKVSNADRSNSVKKVGKLVPRAATLVDLSHLPPLPPTAPPRSVLHHYMAEHGVATQFLCPSVEAPTARHPTRRLIDRQIAARENLRAKRFVATAADSAVLADQLEREFGLQS